MIYLFTDFGYNGPYVGQMKSVLASAGPHISIIDLMHDAPAFNPRASAILLSALSAYMSQESITVAVIDPGVGNPERKALMIEADGRWFVGPDNGLFQHIVKNASRVSCYELLVEQSISRTFHGRDVFAPAAAQLAKGKLPTLQKIDVGSLVTKDVAANSAEIIYIDHYGNAMTGVHADAIHPDQAIIIDGKTIGFAATFSSVSKGTLFWYINSIGLVEISINSGNAAMEQQLFIGKTFEVS